MIGQLKLARSCSLTMPANKIFAAVLATTLLFSSTLGGALHWAVGCSAHSHATSGERHAHGTIDSCPFHANASETTKHTPTKPTLPHDCDDDCAVCTLLAQALHFSRPNLWQVSHQLSETIGPFHVSLTHLDPIGTTHPRGPPVV